ncbi:MAG: hypothetical protein ABI634_17130 [Acidobacteriota bacterium]
MISSTVKRVYLMMGMVVAGAVAAGCNMQKPSSSATAPTPIGADTGAGAFVALWATPNSPTEVAKLSTCSNFQWSATTQVGNTVSGKFTAVCLGTYEVTGTANGELTGPTSMHIVLNGSTVLPTVGNCLVTLTTDGTLTGDVIRLPYTAQTCIGTYSGVETLSKNKLFPPAPPPPAPEPPAPPPPPPTPDPTPVPEPADQIDLNQVTIVLGPKNIGAWPQTSTMTGVTTTDGLCTFHTKLGRWPTVEFFDTGAPIEGNQWVFANINGRWYGGAGEWQRPGQACKAVTAEDVGSGTFYADNWEPLRSWVPRPGELFAMMVSTPARAWPSMRTVDERSNVVLARWGQ